MRGTRTHSPILRRPAVGLGLAVALLATQFAVQAVQAADCPLSPAGVSREDSSFQQPRLLPEVNDEVLVFLRSDPDARFTSFNCEVDSFTTTPKTSVPDYALPTLRALGLPERPQAPQLIPSPTSAGKPKQNLDADLTRMIPLEPEADAADPRESEPDLVHLDDGIIEVDPGLAARPLMENRTKPAVDLEPRDNGFEPPTQAQTDRESAAATPILSAFVNAHSGLFRAGRSVSTLQKTDFRIARFFRKATYEQMVDGRPLIGGRMIVLFDANWNVIAISRMIATPEKLYADMRVLISESQAHAAARQAVAEKFSKSASSLTVKTVQQGTDPTRRHGVYIIGASLPGVSGFDMSVMVHAISGAVLNISDNTLAYTDAKLRRWAYTNGDRDNAIQIISSGQYTRDDNTLRHDFFYMATDERDGGGDASVLPEPCPESQGANTLARLKAYGTTSGAQDAIRHTHRSNRDFSIWSPASSSGSFSESHTYYWSRQFFLWLRQAMIELGAVPSPYPDSKRLMILLNTCIDDVGKANGTAIATQHNEAESHPKVWLSEKCRSGNPMCPPDSYDDSGGNFVTCEGNGCHPHPWLIEHEINHFVMGTMVGIGSGLDCAGSTQLRFLHEGALGSFVPHAHWHHYYGVGYNPPEDRLFTADKIRGQIHADDASKLTRPNYPCSSNTSGQGPYEAGRVVGQPLWEIHHGIRATATGFNGMLRPATDTDSMILTFWAADLVAASTYKDRWEMANRYMQIILTYGNLTPAQEASIEDEWCETWDHHALNNYNDYC